MAGQSYKVAFLLTDDQDMLDAAAAEKSKDIEVAHVTSALKRTSTSHIKDLAVTDEASNPLFMPFQKDALQSVAEMLVELEVESITPT